MVRRHLARDIDAFMFCASDSFYSPLCRHVSYVDVCASFFGQNYVADSVYLFGECGHALETEKERYTSFVHDAAGRKRFVFAMIYDGQVKIDLSKPGKHAAE